jgi:hypothetical protein
MCDHVDLQPIGHDSSRLQIPILGCGYSYLDHKYLYTFGSCCVRNRTYNSQLLIKSLWRTFTMRHMHCLIYLAIYIVEPKASTCHFCWLAQTLVIYKYKKTSNQRKLQKPVILIISIRC